MFLRDIRERPLPGLLVRVGSSALLVWRSHEPSRAFGIYRDRAPRCLRHSYRTSGRPIILRRSPGSSCRSARHYGGRLQHRAAFKAGSEPDEGAYVPTAIAVIPGFMKLPVSLFRDRVGRAGDFCGRRFCGALFHHDRHLHAAVAESAVVIADRLERTGCLRRYCYRGNLAGLDVGVDF